MLLVDVDSRFSFESGGSAAGVGVGDDAGGGEDARTLHDTISGIAEIIDPRPDMLITAVN